MHRPQQQFEFTFNLHKHFIICVTVVAVPAYYCNIPVERMDGNNLIDKKCSK